ncbi:hypothetical protein NKI56_08460 [Mesorhizobium sp. M0622]|uniref:DUF7674 family protein n=1 Tax=unclassified Mesorhizobium TaxID=325217 RepID=UPI00333E17F4
MTGKNEAADFTFDGSNMFEPLLLADPSFRREWDKFQDEWRNETEEPLYLALSELALHLIHNLELGETDRFGDIFDVVERWIVEGNRYVREAAIVGLLEDLQNANLHRSTQPDHVKPWLRPQSAIWWTKLNAFWSDGTPSV